MAIELSAQRVVRSIAIVRHGTTVGERWPTENCYSVSFSCLPTHNQSYRENRTLAGLSSCFIFLS